MSDYKTLVLKLDEIYDLVANLETIERKIIDTLSDKFKIPCIVFGRTYFEGHKILPQLHTGTEYYFHKIFCRASIKQLYGPKDLLSRGLEYPKLECNSSGDLNFWCAPPPSESPYYVHFKTVVSNFVETYPCYIIIYDKDLLNIHPDWKNFITTLKDANKNVLELHLKQSKLSKDNCKKIIEFY